MIRMLVYLHKRKTGFTKKEKRKRTNIQVHRRSRHRYSRTHNHLPRRPHQPISSIPNLNPPPFPKTTDTRKKHSPAQKKRWKHHPHQSNRNRIMPLISQRKTRSTLRIALKCRPPPPLSPWGKEEETHNLRNGPPIGTARTHVHSQRKKSGPSILRF